MRQGVCARFVGLNSHLAVTGSSMSWFREMLDVPHSFESLLLPSHEHIVQHTERQLESSIQLLRRIKGFVSAVPSASPHTTIPKSPESSHPVTITSTPPTDPNNIRSLKDLSCLQGCLLVAKCLCVDSLSLHLPYSAYSFCQRDASSGQYIILVSQASVA